MKRHLRVVYAIWARLYDRWIDRMFTFRRSKVIRSLALRRGDAILEAGVGTGLNLPRYPAGVMVTGIDFSEAMLAQARQKRTRARVRLRVMDAAHTTFKADTFDKALATYVLRVSPDPHAVLQEIARVTRPGARFVVLDQFAEGGMRLWKLVEPFQLLLGWGKNHRLTDLLQGTPWKIVSRKRFGRMRGTELVVLENAKRAKPHV